jgi:hypothetical protein
MTDRDIDVVLSIADGWRRKQRGDGPALDNLELVVDKAPLDVLGAAKVSFDATTELHES